jgi:hypothetical protein
MEKKIYLILTQTSSNLSRIIKLFTRAKYNHMSLSFTPSLEPMYSFGRRQPYNPFWGGYVKEAPRKGTFGRFPKTIAAVLELSVEESVYQAMLDKVEAMYRCRERYGYDFIGLCLSAFHIDYRRSNKYYCSSFAAEVLRECRVPGFETIQKRAEPSHFLTYPNAKLIYQGLLKEYYVAS